MSKEKLYIDDGELVYYINENEFIACDEIPIPMLEEIKHLQQKVEQLEKEIERLNNIINGQQKRIDKTIEAIDEILVYNDLTDTTSAFGNASRELKFYLSECETLKENK